MRTRVKICGITRAEDALTAARLGADAIGLVFYAQSPRAVDSVRARSIVKVLPPFVTVVGLFVDAEPQDIRRVLQAVSIDVLQFHGDEPPEHCGSYGRPYIKALRVRPGMDISASAAHYADAAGVLLDTYQQDVPGGTGKPFDWSQVPANLGKPVVLAGGLSPDNVATAIKSMRPWAVDVSGGVESSKGIKDDAKMAEFIREVNRVQVD